MINLSVAIITLNEERRIEHCVNAVKSFADEIVVVDSYSSDKTKEICEKLPVRFIENAFEFDVDALCDGEEVFIAGIMQHIEEAGVHSGDSSCVLPPYDMSSKVKKDIIDMTTKLALELNVVGLINLQFAVKNNEVYVLEVNPRSSRTVPFVSKYSNVPLANIAAQLSVGKKIREVHNACHIGFAKLNSSFRFKHFRHTGLAYWAVGSLNLKFQKKTCPERSAGLTVLLFSGGGCCEWESSTPASTSPL